MPKAWFQYAPIAISALSLTTAICALAITIFSRRKDALSRSRELADRATAIVNELRLAKRRGQTVNLVRAQEADVLCRQAQIIRPKDPYVLRQSAACADVIGDYAVARRRLEEAITIAPRDHDNYCQLAVTLVHAADFEAAESTIRTARETYPKCRNVSYHLAMLRNLQGRYDEAVTAMEEAVRLLPREAQRVADYGSALSNAGRYLDAIEQFKKALELDVDGWHVHVNIGKTYERLGAQREALKAYDIALTIFPENPEALALSGVLLNNFGDDPSSAEQRFRAALKLRPGDAKLLEHLVVVLGRQDKRAEAARVYQLYREFAGRQGATLRTDIAPDSSSAGDRDLRKE